MRRSLRFWAFRQFLHCCGLFAKEVVRSLRVFAVKRNKRRSRYVFDDLKAWFQDDIVQTMLHGHLNQTPFVGLQDEFPEIRSLIATTTDRLVSFAVEYLKRREQGDVEKSGLLHGYAAAQRQHLVGCERCRTLVVGVIAGDMVRLRNRAGLKNGKANRRD